MSNQSQDDEKELIGLAANGDFPSFEKLVRRTEDRLYAHLMRMTGSQEEARDLLQETYLSAYRNLKNFRGGSSFFTWVYRIATNHALMQLRKKRPEVELDELTIPTHAELKNRKISDWDLDPLQALCDSEVKKILYSAIEKLPPTFKAVVVLRDMEGLSTEETAKILEIAEGAVKTRLHRARIYLREQLGAHFNAEEFAGGRNER